MTEKIIFVDDENHILDSMKRQLRKRFDLCVALSGAEALEMFKNRGPFAVIISDMRMPVMDGIELLNRIKDLYPETVRLMLTGNADQETAIEAVNKGQIFRFLTKPCPVPLLVTSIALALRQYRLVVAEKELLEKTLKGCVKVLSELLSFTNPTAFSSGVRIQTKVMAIAAELSLTSSWQLEIASLLSQIGCITLPREILDKVYSGNNLTEEEILMYRDHPKFGSELLENIPRMEEIASIIKNQLTPYSDYDIDHRDEELNVAAQIIKAVNDYDLLLYQGVTHKEAVKKLLSSHGEYNPEILKALKQMKLSVKHPKVAGLKVLDLSVGMVADENIIARNGMLLVPKGQEINSSVLQGLLNFSRQVGVKEPVRVRIAQMEQDNEKGLTPRAVEQR